MTKHETVNQCILVSMLAFTSLASAQTAPVTKDQVDAAKNAIDLRVYQETQDLLVQKSAAEARKAIAEAEKAEAAAKIPPTDIKALSGSTNTEKFGAAGLVKAFDLAKTLASTVCDAIDTSTVVVYDQTTVPGVVTAKLVESEILRFTKAANEAEKVLIEDAGAGGRGISKFWFGVAAVTGGIKAAADLASLFKTNVTATSTPYEPSAARNLFISALAEKCPEKVVGLGSGYLGELDTSKYEELRQRMTALFEARQLLHDGIESTKKRVEKATPDEKERLGKLIASATTFLKQTDVFIETLKPSDFSDKSPIYSAARYLAYAERTRNSNIIDFDLKLEGLTITRENIFVGQRLRLSGVALLWYRVYNPNGALIKARTLRQITRPVEVNLRGTDAPGDFWEGPVEK